MSWLHSIQAEHWDRIGYTPALRDLPGVGTREGVSAVDIEHSLCEIDKWLRIAMPELAGSKTSLKRHGGVRKNGVTNYYPLKWACYSNEAICDDVDPIIVNEEGGQNDFVNGEDDVWEVSHVVMERGEGKGKECLIRWVGYAPQDDLWRLESELAETAPDVLAAWSQRKLRIANSVREVSAYANISGASNSLKDKIIILRNRKTAAKANRIATTQVLLSQRVAASSRKK
jgi:hypothetical protein